MAVSVEKYRNLDYALRKLRTQIIEGLPYAVENCPQFTSPEQIFNWLRLHTVYKKDPKNVELFQCLPTLLDGSRTGTPGAGDCDCFTIALLTLLTANGFHNLNGDDCGIILAGRNRFVPVHIYAYAVIDGEKKILDLTNQYFDYERPGYSYKQEIPFKINPLEEKKMILELAEGVNEFLSGKKSNPKKEARHVYHATKKGMKRQEKIDSYKDIPIPMVDTKSPFISTEVDDSYTYLPESEVHVRNDVYDDLSAGEFQDLMLSEGVEPYRILQLSAGRASRKNVKATGKATKKVTKTADKGLTKQTKAELKTRISGEDKAKVRTKLFDKAGNLIQTYIGGKPAPEEGEEPTEKTASKTAPEKKEEKKTINVLGMELTPMQAGLGGLALVGILFLGAKAIKKGKKK